MIGATSAGTGQGSTFYVILPIFRQRAESNVSCVLSAVGQSEVGGGLLSEGASNMVPVNMISHKRSTSRRGSELLGANCHTINPLYLPLTIFLVPTMHFSSEFYVIYLL